jgi:DNA-directed RNA polymerase alpha subunit
MRGLKPRTITLLVMFYFLDGIKRSRPDIMHALTISERTFLTLKQDALKRMRQNYQRDQIIANASPGRTPIEAFDFTPHIEHCLKRAGIRTVETLTDNRENDLLAIPIFSARRLDEVIAKLGEHGLKLKDA